MDINKPVVLTVAVIYVFVMIGFIIYLTLRKEQKNMEDFAIGGRGLGWLTSSLSSMASLSSGFVFIALAGLGYTLGAFGAWYIFVDSLGVVLLWTFFAWRLKRIADVHKSIDLPDLLSDIYNDKGNVLRIITTVAVAIFMMGYVPSQLATASKTIESIFGLPFEWGVFMAGVIVLAYTVAAGFTGVAVTDTVQGFIMMFAGAVVPIVALANIGGWGAFTTALGQVDPGLVSARGTNSLLSTSALIMGWMASSFSYWGQPHVVTRIMAIKDVKLMKRAGLASAIFTALIRPGGLIIGMTARVLLPELTDPEWAYPMLVAKLFNPVLVGILICAILAAIITTADSQLLAASTALTRNIYQKVLKRGQDVDGKKVVLYTRLLTVVLCFFSGLFAITAKGLVFWMILFAFVGSGAAMGIPLIVRLYWKRANIYGGVAGSIVGLLTVILWKLTGLSTTIVREGVPGLIFALVTVIAVSLVTQPSESLKNNVKESQ